MPNCDQEGLRYNYSDSSSSAEEEEEEEEEANPSGCGKTLNGGGCGLRRGDEGRVWGKVLDPRATWVQEWNRLFLLVCAVGLFVDPLFFYTLSISESCMCLFVDGWFAVTVTVLRCMIDALHLWNVWLQFYMNGRPGPGMHDAAAVAFKYFKSKKGFFFDVFVILPLPQKDNTCNARNR